MPAGGEPAPGAAGRGDGERSPHPEMAGERSAARRAALLPAGRETGRGGGGGGRGRGRGRGPADFVALLPPEVSSRIFSDLDVESLCHAAGTCKGWHRVIESDDRLWRHHCLSVRAVCQREIDCDRGNGYSWKVTLLRNYRKSKVKQEWLSGKYSNIPSQNSLPEKSMYPVDADTWGEILEAELER